jgi:methionyl-tRNA synthetase
MKKPFYISTAIAYASAIPHVGNVYEAILADAIARFKRLDGYDVYFQTGTDEHGQKIESRAAGKGMEPQAYTDLISNEIKRIYAAVGVEYDYFIRTTDENHRQVVQAIFKKLYDQGDIYLGKYAGWYSVSEESFIAEKDIVDGKGPNGDTLVWTEEETFFFDLKKYQPRLIEHIQNHPEFIAPESRKNEMLNNFLSEPLQDLSVSRTSFKWGIPTFDPKHVIYVWIDALTNYISGLDLDASLTPSEKFKKYWPADIHLIGKDILRFHTIYWPIMLMALGLELPKTVFGHPWVLIDKSKMSKSLGNTMYVDDILKFFKKDTLRYYVLHEIPFAADGNLTYELLIERNNTDLANTLGNLVNRTIGMANKYRGGLVKKANTQKTYEISLVEATSTLLEQVRSKMDEYRVADAIEEIMKVLRQANKFIDVTEPWKLFKDETAQAELDGVLYELLETIRITAVVLRAFIPDTANEILRQINTTKNTFDSITTFGGFEDGTQLNAPVVLFERYNPQEKLEEILKG